MRTFDELEAMWQAAADEPRSARVALITLRRGGGEHEVANVAEVSAELGLVGDRWAAADAPDPDHQLTLMDVRVARLLCGDDLPLHLPGDNFLVDLDLAAVALPVGTRLRLGEALVEISPAPHTGCRKFQQRFGTDALRWINAQPHRPRRLRGINCRVLAGGAVRIGDGVAPEGGS